MGTTSWLWGCFGASFCTGRWEIFNHSLIEIKMYHLWVSFLGLPPQSAANWVASTILEVTNLTSRCQQGWFFSGASLLGLYKEGPCLPLPHVASLCVCPCPNLFFFCQDTRHMGWGSPHMTSLYLNCLFEDPASKFIHSMRSWELGLEHRNFVGDTVQLLPIWNGEDWQLALFSWHRKKKVSFLKYWI